MKKKVMEFKQLCVWEGCIVGEDKDQFLEIMKNTFPGCEFKYECEVKTLPGFGGEGGRNDLFFYVSADSITKFAVQRFAYGIRWWEDVLGNGGSALYTSEHLAKYPKTW